MGFVWEANLRCGNCNAAFKGRPIEYDDLGYPICPACGESHGPTSPGRPGRRESFTGQV